MAENDPVADGVMIPIANATIEGKHHLASIAAFFIYCPATGNTYMCYRDKDIEGQYGLSDTEAQDIYNNYDKSEYNISTSSKKYSLMKYPKEAETWYHNAGTTPKKVAPKNNSNTYEVSPNDFKAWCEKVSLTKPNGSNNEHLKTIPNIS